MLMSCGKYLIIILACKPKIHHNKKEWWKKKTLIFKKLIIKIKTFHEKWKDLILIYYKTPPNE